MSLIRSFIIKEWAKFFLASLVTLFLLITTANLISGLLRGNVTAMEVLLNHLIEIPDSLKKILPISVLMGPLFCINKLKNRNELTAIFAGGFSRKDFMSTLGICSVFVALLQFWSSGILHPYMKSKRHEWLEDSTHKFRNLQSKGLSSSTITSGKIWFKGPNYFFSFAAYDELKRVISDATILFFDTKTHLLKKRIQATSLEYQAGQAWLIKKGSILATIDQDQFPLRSQVENLIITLSEGPEEFFKIKSDITTLDVFKLKGYINQLEESGLNTDEYKMMFYDVFSTSLICIIFGLLSSASAFNPNRRSSSFGVTLAVVFIFSLLYWLSYSYGMELGKSSKLGPETASFAVPAVFTSILIIYALRNTGPSR